MRAILTIARKELSSFFDSLGGYIILILFLLTTGLFTWITQTNILYVGRADLSIFFTVAQWTLFFFAPALTMRSFSEELERGTFDLLQTKPVSLWQIVAGKFLAYFSIILIALVFTLPYYVTVSFLGDIDNAEVIGGYLGLILSGAVYVAIGIFASTLTKNQIVSFLVALAISAFFQVLADLLMPVLPVWLGEIMFYFSLPEHFWSVARGVIDSKDIVFFLSFTALGLYSAVEILNSKRW